MTYDLAIIGGGPGGYVAAAKASLAGLKVLLFEKRELGGVCLNEGCIPTKVLLNCAKTLQHTLGGKAFGVNVGDVQADFGKMMERKSRVVRRLSAGVKTRLKAAGVETVKEAAVVKGRCGSGAIVLSAGEDEYQAKNLLVCTGSSAVIPPIPGIGTSEAVLTSRDALSLTECPGRLAIIGGGVIGMEFASFFRTLGTKVTVIEMLPQILGGTDSQISAMLRDIYVKRGVEFHLGCRVTGIDGHKVSFVSSEGETGCTEADCILVSAGRRPNIEGLGLEALGVEFALNRNGKPCGIKVDSHMRTTASGVYAAGDVTGFSLLAHTASREGEVAVNDILGIADEMSYSAIPSVVYTNPEAASVGVTEQNAPEGSIIRTLPMAYSGRYVAENEDITGICKIIADGSTHKLLGMHMLGTPCSEIIQSGCIAIEAGLTLEQLEKIAFPHPTVSEIIKETITQ